MQIFTFNCNSQRLRRYTSGVIYAGSYPNTVFKFNFNTSDWNLAFTKTAVFSARGKNYRETIDENNMCKVPEEVLVEGTFVVSVNGGGLITNSIRIPVAANPMGDIDDATTKPSMVYIPTISENKILSWTLGEATPDLVVPNPVDLNPYDEWEGDEIETDYIWEDET